MVELQHAIPEPSGLTRYRRKHSGGKWEKNPELDALRPVIRQQLHREQEGLCVYCERTLGADEGHIEHIQTRSSRPDLTFAYDNFAHSCEGPGHCGRHRNSQALPVEPRPGCNRFFALMALDGRLEPHDGLSDDEKEQAEETIRVLGLNAEALSWRRKAFVDALLGLPIAAEQSEFLVSVPFRWSLRGLL